MIYAKLAALLGILAAFAWGAMADYSAGKKAGQSTIQEAWDKDKAAIQATADAAIATATKERDTALEANEAIANDYQKKVDAANGNAADFARRLRSALAATSSGPASQSPDNPQLAATRAAAVAQQLGQVVGLTADLYADCKANADQLDSLISELKPQL